MKAVEENKETTDHGRQICHDQGSLYPSFLDQYTTDGICNDISKAKEQCCYIDLFEGICEEHDEVEVEEYDSPADHHAAQVALHFALA